LARTPRLPSDLASNPVWHLLDYSPLRHNFVFTRLEEAQYAQALFLDFRLQSQISTMESVGFDEVNAAFPDAFSQPPAAYIFHVGHCGSTLLSRALGVAREVLALREPMTLGALATARRELGDPLAWFSPPQWERLQMIILLALERRFRPGQLPVIKASSTCNILAEPILASHPQRKAVLLRQSLETTLATLFKVKGNSSDLRTLARDRLHEWHCLTGSKAMRLVDTTDEDIAVISWLASMQRFQNAQARFPDRVLRLDFDAFLAAPDSGLQRVADFIGLAPQSDHIVAAYNHVAQSYSKNPGASYSAADRKRELDLSRSQNAARTRACLLKARSLLDAHPDLAELGAWLDA
jgi:hypothetical protein